MDLIHYFMNVKCPPCFLPCYIDNFGHFSLNLKDQIKFQKHLFCLHGLGQECYVLEYQTALRTCQRGWGSAEGDMFLACSDVFLSFPFNIIIHTSSVEFISMHDAEYTFIIFILILIIRIENYTAHSRYQKISHYVNIVKCSYQMQPNKRL